MRTPTPDPSHGTRSQEYDDELLKSMIDSDLFRQVFDVKRQRRKYCARQKRRKVPKASHPGCGMGARRIHAVR
jgi:hypothetical protein